MSTTFTLAFKNKLIDSITGKATNSFILNSITGYSGAQAADPLTAPAGTLIHTSWNVSALLSTNMSFASGGISALSTPINANAANVATAAFARIFNSSGAAVIDTPMSLSGGGGGVIVPILTSSVGVPFQISEFSIKLPSDNGGTLMMNDAMRDDIVNITVKTAANLAIGSSASINIYSGTPPANANMAATGTLLLTLSTAALGASWNTASGGSSSLVSNISAVAVATGTAGYARLEKGGYVLQGSVGISGTDFVIDNTAIVSGNTFALTNATITL